MGQEQAYTECSFHAGPDRLSVTGVLVTAGSDLYAREIQTKISTPQDTLDARHHMTTAET